MEDTAWEATALVTKSPTAPQPVRERKVLHITDMHSSWYAVSISVLSPVSVEVRLTHTVPHLGAINPP